MTHPKRKLGSVFQRKQDGRWAAAVTLPDGKRVTRYVHRDHPNPERGVHELLATLIVEAGTQAGILSAGATVSEWLDQHLVRINRGRAAATVRDRKYLARSITTTLGRIRLDKLTAAQVQAWIDQLPGAHRGRLKALQLLRSALNEAMALGHLTRNVALPVTIERQPARKAGTSWTVEQAQTFLVANEKSGQYLLWKLGLQTGARIGELLALRVGDYTPERGSLRIERTVTLGAGAGTRREIGKTKTEAGTRTFPLPQDARRTVEAMIERGERLAAKAGPAWQEQGWLFPSEVGTMYGYDNARRAWRQAIARAGVPVIRTHDMRVTFISLALKRGVKPEVVARMVGHSSPLITLRIYRQVFDDEIEEAGEMVANLV